MTPEEKLRDKLRKIEALFAGAGTAGERLAAGAAAERIRERLDQTAATETEIENKFSISDTWSRQLFTALCRRYGLRPYRYPRMHRQSIMVRAPESFVDQILWPEFQELDAALCAWLSEITEKVIREAVYAKTGEADEVTEPPQIGGGRYAPQSESAPHDDQGNETANAPFPPGHSVPGHPVPGQHFETGKKVGRNAPCPCGSGKKFKRCCLKG